MAEAIQRRRSTMMLHSGRTSPKDSRSTRKAKRTCRSFTKPHMIGHGIREQVLE
jgi:hypothetical protein